MNIGTFLNAQGNGVRIPLSAIERVRLVFPAEKIIHQSRGINRTELLPTRYYETPSGQWATDDPDLLRLLHNDFPFILERVAKLSRDTEFIATATNYGSNPYYCIRRPHSERGPVRLFHLEQEKLHEPHWGLSAFYDSDRLQLAAVQVTFDARDQSATDSNGQKLPDDALIITAPAVVWNRKFVGWENYVRATYDCRHVINLQYVNRDKYPDEFERIRAEIQRVQRLWEDRDKYVEEVLRLANSVGYAEYARLMIGVMSEADNRFLLLASIKGTAEDAAAQLIRQCPDIDAAFQIAEGGGTGIVMGTPSDWRVLGPSSYRRGRVLCCLLVEMKCV
ncbi:MAG: hypothetical protein ACE5MK_07275 [Acidobacteriota bacterium]